MPPKRDNKNRPRNRGQTVEINAMADCVLPREMLPCILSRLPVKSLIRFKSICKWWQGLISTSKFIKIHYDQFRRAPKTCSVKFHSLSNLVMVSTKTIRGNQGEVFIDCCRGLVCVGRPMFSQDIVLWNPATNQWKTLPHSEEEFPKLETVSLGFGCNADDAVCGYNYKVVRLLGLKGEKLRTGVEVYSSKRDSWKRINVGFKFMVIVHSNHAIVNGSPYWIAYLDDDRRAVEGKECKVLLGFDCAKMEFKIVPMPNLEEEDVKFVEWKGSLGGVVFMKNKDNLLESIVVWVYDDGESVWKMKESYRGFKLQVKGCMNVSKNGKIYGSCMNGEFFIYAAGMKNLATFDLRSDRWINFQIFAYEESLAYVQGMKPMVVWKDERKEKNIDIIDGFFITGLNDRQGAYIRCFYALGC